MGIAEGFVKFLVFGANVVFAVVGLVLLTIGIIYKLNIGKFTDAIPPDYQNIGLAPILTITIGAVIFVIAFFGCCGVWKESSCLLTTYAVILLVLFLLQVALGVFAFIEIKDKDELKIKVENTVSRIFDKYDPKDNKTHELVDVIQKELECCGISGPSYWNDKINTIPSSCCDKKECTKENSYREPCPDALFETLSSALQIIAITVLSLSAMEVLGAMFSLCLSNTIKNRERRFRY